MKQGRKRSALEVGIFVFPTLHASSWSDLERPLPRVVGTEPDRAPQ